MKLAVLGANGRTGQQVLRVALEKGIDVTAVVRSESKRPDIQHGRLAFMVGDPCDPTFLETVFDGQDAVISTLGGRRPTKAATSVYYRSADAIVQASQGTGTQRVLMTSTALLFPATNLIERLLKSVVRNVVRSATRMEHILQTSDLKWTFARCGFLTDNNAAQYRAENGSLPTKGSSVSRLALAHFLVDMIDNPDADHAGFGVSGPTP